MHDVLLNPVAAVCCVQTVVTGAVNTVADGAALVGKVSGRPWGGVPVPVNTSPCQYRPLPIASAT